MRAPDRTRATEQTEETVERGGSGSAPRILDFLREYADGRFNSRLVDERRCLPPSAVLELGGAGLLGLQIEKEYGGQGLSHRETFRVMEQIAAIDPNLTLLVSVHNAIGVPPVRHFADDARKAEVLPLLASGRALATIAASEPGVGSDVRAMSTTARRLPTGAYLLNGAKSWISLGSWAGYVSVFAQLRDEDDRPQGVTGFLVEGGTAGFHPGEEALTLGMKGIPQNHIAIRDLSLPADALLGQEGQGLTTAQNAFMAGRAFVGANSLGAMKRCLQIALRYASKRDIATGNLLGNGVTQQILADAVLATRAVENLVLHLADRLDEGREVPGELYFACKILSSELMWRVVDSSVQMLGARGYLDTNVVGQYFRDYRLLRIFEGATEAVTVYLGGTVLKDPHAFLAALVEQFGESPAVAALRDCFEELPGLDAPAGDSPQRHVLANSIGELASWAILAAASDRAAAVDEFDGQVAAWCRHSLVGKVRSYRANGKRPLDLTAGFLAEHISAYRDTIGDTEQSLPGEAAWRDPLLARV